MHEKKEKPSAIAILEHNSGVSVWLKNGSSKPNREHFITLEWDRFSDSLWYYQKGIGEQFISQALTPDFKLKAAVEGMKEYGWQQATRKDHQPLTFANVKKLLESVHEGLPISTRAMGKIEMAFNGFDRAQLPAAAADFEHVSPIPAHVVHGV
jgi:hypothetical protein